jgi:hypothetical protein
MPENNIITYPYLIKRAIKITIEFLIIMIILFFLPDIIKIFLDLYGY